MKVTDTLFTETLKRVGPDELVGVRNLLAEGHTGIAEKHTVNKLIAYVRGLEEKLGINIPDPKDKSVLNGKLMKINEAGVSYFVPSPA